MKKFVSGLIIGSIITTSISALAGGVWDKIDVLKNDINIMVNGKQIFSDNFLYNDTTYLPLRTIAEELGQKVTYDEVTNTAHIGSVPENNVVAGGSVGSVPDTLWIEKDGKRYTNDEFQLPVYDATKDIKPYKCVSAEAIATKANEITNSDRFCFLTDEIGIFERFAFNDGQVFLQCERSIPIEDYYTIVQPKLRALE